MKMYRVRVDGEVDERLVDFCKKLCDKWLLVHHVTTTDNPHYHIYCESTLSQGNFSNKIKSVLGVSGGDYSNKTCDVDRKLEYLSYLFNTKKGNKPRLVSYEGFSPIDVEIYRENATKIAQEFQTRMKDQKKTQYDVAMTALGRMSDGQAHLPEYVYQVVIDVLKESKLMARPNHVRDIMATIMAYSDNRQARTLIKDITLKFFS